MLWKDGEVMLYINTQENQLHNCGFYFGLEEYLIKDYDYFGDIFLLWSVKPTVMIGRHQITLSEIDQSYVNKHNISIVRRNSGGGAVYTDKGCLQFSFITNKKNHANIFEGYVDYIVNAVRKLGINAEFTGRNDILSDNLKFSGNAEYIYKDKMVIHGTILFESDFNHLVGCLTPDKTKLTSHAIESVKSRVVNIGDKIDMSIDQFYNYMVDEVKTDEVDYTSLDISKIMEYANKFETQEWNYDKNPPYSLEIKKKYPAGNFTIHVDIKKDVVHNLKIKGDFFSLKKINNFENAFIGVKYTYNGFLEVLKQYKVRDYFLNLKTKEFLEMFFEPNIKKRISKPDYLKIDMKDLNKETKRIKSMLKEHHLFTVCQEANCPNQMECFSNKTATFMILGNQCTRNCSFCDVTHGEPLAVDPEEPSNIVKAVKLMGLKHVVITSVTRDDLDDYGSKQFVKCIELLKKECPFTTIEVLIPDFMGDFESLKRVVDARPDVINHNLETVRRLYQGFRDNADYDRSLHLLKTIKDIDPDMLTKSGIMVGIGEIDTEVFSLMKDLRDIHCDIMTIGQYLRPSNLHIAVKEYITLEAFKMYEKKGKELGFKHVASGPLVRSSYQASKQFKGE